MGIDELHEMLVEAAETERRLPPVIRKTKMASWPDYPLDWHGYGWSQQGEVMLKPTAEQISNMDWVVERVLKLEQQDRQIVWAAAHSAAFRRRGPQWTRIRKILGLNDPRIVKKMYKDALIKLWYQL
jgi:hypothetical protein|tara:strand:- start:1118 stop:1498 length:381 start_codon:yes stop_codon:yes gene_type:complete